MKRVKSTGIRNRSSMVLWPYFGIKNRLKVLIIKEDTPPPPSSFLVVVVVFFYYAKQPASFKKVRATVAKVSGSSSCGQ